MRNQHDFESSFDRAMNGLDEIDHAGPGPNNEDGRARNRYALAGLILSILFDPFLLGLVFSIVGLVRAARTGVGKAMAWTGIVLSAVWLAATVVYVVPALTAKTNTVVEVADKRADPGCKAMQVFLASPLGSKDISKDDARTLETDLDGMVAALTQAAAQSKDPTAKAAITKMAGDFQTLHDDVKAGKEPPPSLQTAITNDSDAVDKACGNG